MIEKASVFEKNRLIKVEIDNAIGLLKQFRVKYPFAENPDSIETLSPEDIFREQRDEVGEFFHWLVYDLNPIGHLAIHDSNVYRQIRSQFADFKELLYVVVDREKSLAKKVDARWGQIKGLGQDEHIAKKIIFCFNYENGEVLPIFKTSDLEHFFNEIVAAPSCPAQYVSLGEKYAYLNSELLMVKENVPETQSWELPYFSRFLYDNYPPSPIKPTSFRRSNELKPSNEEKKEQVEFREFSKLLVELQSKKKISGEEFRLNRKLWEDYPQNRESLIERLRLLLKK